MKVTDWRRVHAELVAHWLRGFINGPEEGDMERIRRKAAAVVRLARNEPADLEWLDCREEYFEMIALASGIRYGMGAVRCSR